MAATGKNNVGNVSAAKPKVGGAVFVAPIDTTLPTDAKTDLDAAFKCMGYVSEDGFTHDISRESEDTKAWGGDTVATNESGRNDNIQLTFIEMLNVDVLKFIYGSANVSGTLETGIAVKAKSTVVEEYAVVIDTVLKGNTLHRKVFPRGVVGELGEVPYKDSEVVGYETTIKGLPDAEGVTHYEYSIKGTATETSAENESEGDK